MTPPIHEPFDCPSIYSWLQASFLSQSLASFPTLQELVTARSSSPTRNSRDLDQWRKLTPRTLLFTRFFTSMQDDWSPAQFVEALSTVGVDNLFLETLPEAVLAPLQEAIVQCQSDPPTTWDKDLLAIVSREDVNMLLNPGERPRRGNLSLLVSFFSRSKQTSANIFRRHCTKRIWMFIPYVSLQQMLKLPDHLMDLLKWSDKQSAVRYLKMIEG